MEQDWNNVVFKKTEAQKKLEQKKLAKNQPKITIDRKLQKVDNTEIDKIKTISLKASKVISKRRTELKLSQKQLAQQLNLKPEIIVQYENGKAKPNQAIIVKLERILGVYLSGKHIGELKQGKK